MRMNFILRAGALLALGASIVSACGPSSDVGRSAVAGGEFRLERFCAVPDLKPSLRHTYLLLDEGALTKTDTPEEFAASNAGIRDAVLAFANPSAGIQSGAVDYRERISILLMPRDGSAAHMLFEGCVPALSPEELAASRAEGSAVGDFFTGGIQQALRNDSEEFRNRVVSAIVLAARAAPGPAKAEQAALPATQLMASLRASGRLINGDTGLPRIVLLANLAKVDIGGAQTREAAREAGFAAGTESGLDLGRAELHITLIQGNANALAREYADAFFLAQHAKLLSWGAGAPALLPAAPVSLRRFAGEAAYPSGPETIQIRIGTDRNGGLVDSWITLRGAPDRSTPLTGQQTCAEAGKCTLRSDDAGFAQAWSTAPGGDPEFRNDAPFGGVRDWEFTLDGPRLSGRVFDPAVQIGSSNAIGITATEVEDATF